MKGLPGGRHEGVCKATNRTGGYGIWSQGGVVTKRNGVLCEKTPAFN